jgi:hypothetical protein
LRFRQHRSVVNLLPRRRRRRSSSSSSARVHPASFSSSLVAFLCIFELCALRASRRVRRRQRERVQLLFFMSLAVLCCWLLFSREP